eukprot:2759591-Amphidinium_carterae.1
MASFACEMLAGGGGGTPARGTSLIGATLVFAAAGLGGGTTVFTMLGAGGGGMPQTRSWGRSLTIPLSSLHGALVVRGSSTASARSVAGSLLHGACLAKRRRFATYSRFCSSPKRVQLAYCVCGLKL